MGLHLIFVGCRGRRRFLLGTLAELPVLLAWLQSRPRLVVSSMFCKNPGMGTVKGRIKAATRNDTLHKILL
jgi:hypothetical protein